MTSPSQLARVAIVRAGYELALVAAGNDPELAARVATERARNAVQALGSGDAQSRWDEADVSTLSRVLYDAELPCYGGCRVPYVIGIGEIVIGIAGALRIYDRMSARLAPLHARAEHGVDHASEEHGVRHGAQPGSGPVERKSGGAIRRATGPVSSLKEGGNAE